MSEYRDKLISSIVNCLVDPEYAQEDLEKLYREGFPGYETLSTDELEMNFRNLFAKHPDAELEKILDNQKSLFLNEDFRLWLKDRY